MNLFGFILFESLRFLDLDICILLWIREIFSHYLFFFNKACAPFSLSFPFGTPLMGILFLLLLSWCSLRISSVFNILFFFFCCSVWVSSTTLSSRSLIYSAASSCLLLNTSSVFFTSVIIFFSSLTSVWYFLIFSIFLLKITRWLCILLSSVSIS